MGNTSSFYVEVAHQESRLAIDRRVNLYDARGKPDQAAEWRAKRPEENPPSQVSSTTEP